MNFDDTARFFGPSNKLWPELFAPPSKRATILCRNCRKVEVQGIKRYCGKCAAGLRRKSHRESMRRKRDVTKTEQSPLRAEALTRPENEGRYNDPKTSFSTPGFLTSEGPAHEASEPAKINNTAGGVG
jgi:hypothetical protein